MSNFLVIKSRCNIQELFSKAPMASSYSPLFVSWHSWQSMGRCNLCQASCLPPPQVHYTESSHPDASTHTCQCILVTGVGLEKLQKRNAGYRHDERSSICVQFKMISQEGPIEKNYNKTYRDSNNTILANFLHSPCNQITNFTVAICRYCSNLQCSQRLNVDWRNWQPLQFLIQEVGLTNSSNPTAHAMHSHISIFPTASTYLGYLLGWAYHSCSALQVVNHWIHSKVDPSPQIHGIHSSCHWLAAFWKNGSCKHCCCCCTCEPQGHQG